MLKGFHRFYREHGRRVVQKDPAFPDVKLGVGVAENLRPQPQQLVIVFPAKSPKVQPLAQEGLLYTGEGKIFSESDFPKEGYKGQAIYSF